MLINTASLSYGVGPLLKECEDDPLGSPNFESEASKRCKLHMTLYCVCSISFHACLLLNNFSMMTFFAVYIAATQKYITDSEMSHPGVCSFWECLSNLLQVCNISNFVHH